jgi:hypothetical protein
MARSSRRERRALKAANCGTSAERATDVDDSCLAVDVALLERHPLAGPGESYRPLNAHREPSTANIRSLCNLTGTYPY